MRIGFTGTRFGMSDRQKREVDGYLCRVTSLACDEEIIGVHGGCIGADKDFHDLCVKHGLRIEVRPGHFANNPSDLSCRAELDLDTVDFTHPSDTHLSRNRAIVAGCETLLACPLTAAATRGGTWYTINHAKAKGRAVLIIAREDETSGEQE